jgi:hypothetical protein
MANYEAEELWRAFQTDPVGTYERVGQELAAAGYVAEDPRVAELYAAYTQQQELAAYDAAIQAIMDDPTNADINPNRLHAFVAAADGDFNLALQLYRSDAGTILAAYGLAQPGQPGGFDAAAPLPVELQPPAPDLSPRHSLHRAIEEATRAARRSR